MSNVEKYIDENDMHRNEGRQGVINLCRLLQAIGYKDQQYNGQLAHNASLGDIYDFLSDNSGAIEAIQLWISEQPSFEQELEHQIDADEDEDEDDSEDE